MVKRAKVLGGKRGRCTGQVAAHELIGEYYKEFDNSLRAGNRNDAVLYCQRK